MRRALTERRSTGGVGGEWKIRRRRRVWIHRTVKQSHLSSVEDLLAAVDCFRLRRRVRTITVTVLWIPLCLPSALYGNASAELRVSAGTHQYWLVHSEYFYSVSSSPLLFRGAPDCGIDTASKLTRRSATGNCEWRTCPRSLRCGQTGIRTCSCLSLSERC